MLSERAGSQLRHGARDFGVKTFVSRVLRSAAMRGDGALELITGRRWFEDARIPRTESQTSGIARGNR